MTPQPSRNRGTVEETTLEPSAWTGIGEAELVDVERTEDEVRLSVKFPPKKVTMTVPGIDLDEDLSPGDRVSVLVMGDRTASVKPPLERTD